MLGPLAVLAQVAVWAGAEVLVRLSVDTSTPIDTGVVTATVVQVFVTEQATPVGLTVTVPGLHTAAMHAARVGDTLVTELALPAIAAPALPRHGASPVEQITSLFTHGFFALLAHPAIHAGLVSILVAGVVAEEVVAGPAELVAGGTVVVFVTAHSDLQLQMGHVAAEVQALPAVLRVDHASVGHPLNQQLLIWSGVIVPVPGLHDEGERTRPGELKGNDDEPRVLVAAGPRPRPRSVPRSARRRQVEGVATQHGRGAVAVAAGPRGRHLGLVLLKAHAHVRVALVAAAAPRARRPAVTVTAGAAQQLPVHVPQSAQLQLEIAHGPRRLHAQKQQ